MRKYVGVGRVLVVAEEVILCEWTWSIICNLPKVKEIPSGNSICAQFLGSLQWPMWILDRLRHPSCHVNIFKNILFFHSPTYPPIHLRHLHSPGCPGPSCITRLASASSVLGLYVYTTMPGSTFVYSFFLVCLWVGFAWVCIWRPKDKLLSLTSGF